MLTGFKNSRLGKYYSSVLNKYGTIAPIVAALVAFVVLLSAGSFDVLGELEYRSSAAVVVVGIFLGLCTLLALYYFVSRLGSRKINAVDFVVYVANLLLVLFLIELIFMPSTTLQIVLYIVALLIVAALTMVRMAVARPIAKTLYENKTPNATVKSYFAAFIKRFNILVLAFVGIAILALLYLFDGVEITGSNGWTYLTIISIVLIIATVIFNLPGRIASKRMGQVDAVIALAIPAAVLYAIPLFMNFTVAKLVIWLVALCVLVFFAVLLIKNTYIEKLAPRTEKSTGNRGLKVYFKQLAQKYNLIFAAVIAILGFIVMYSLIAINAFREVETVVTAGFLLILDLSVLILFAGLLASAKRRSIVAGDWVLFALCVFAILAIIPTIQFFSVLKLLNWIALVVLICVTFAVRIVRVAENRVEDAEIYNPATIFGEDNFGRAVNGVKELFSPNAKDSHYISSKESRRIAKENMRTIKEYEKAKKRKNVPESEYVTQMKDDRNIVEFENLHTYFFSDAGVVKAVNGVSFNIPQGSTVGVIGESGCGKSVTSLSLMQLVQAPKGQVMKGSEIRFKSTVYKEDENGNNIPVYEVKVDENGNEIKDENGNPVYVTAPKMHKGKPVLDKDGKPVIEKVQKKDINGVPLFETEEKVYNVAKMPTEVMRKIRGREITMIFQEPMTSLNPIFTIGNQLDEVVFLHVPGATKEMAKARTFEMLKLVGIIPENVYDRYPHELSGGMRQRVMIAMALSCNPKLIIADEPTTALDVTIQAQILDLLRDVKKKINGSIMFITHDLGVIAEMADYVVVMYAGRVIEMGTAKEIFDNPMHPYTMGLQKSKPAVNKKVDRLYSIPGNVPNPINMPNYCYFRDRCDKRCGKCNGDYPDMIQVSPTHKVSCHLYEKED